MWYYVETNHVFYIGKGKNDRYKQKTRRNAYFLNIVNKYGSQVAVKIYKSDLTEEEAWELEKSLIKEYKSKNECEANFHEGGRGGNTGNYKNAERSKKLSESAKKRVGNKNPMFGRHHSEDTKKKLSELNKGKKPSPQTIEAVRKANLGRKLTPKQIDAIKKRHTGKVLSKETYDKMMDSLCKFEYVILFREEEVFRCLGSTALYKYCKKVYNISKTIVNKILINVWKPIFNKHKELSDLKILKIERCID